MLDPEILFGISVKFARRIGKKYALLCEANFATPTYLAHCAHVRLIDHSRVSYRLGARHARAQRDGQLLRGLQLRTEGDAI